MILASSMAADMGGTEILGPLKDIYSKPVNESFSRQASVTDEILKLFFLFSIADNQLIFIDSTSNGRRSLECG